jgi:hypothetical protein
LMACGKSKGVFNFRSLSRAYSCLFITISFTVGYDGLLTG